MEKEEILQVLPQRYPMLMVDDILEVEPEKYVRGYKKIAKDDVWIQGHFPEEPIFPGVLIIETIAQTALFLKHQKETKKNHPYLAKVDQIKFVKPVRPGDELFIEIHLAMKGAGFEKVKAAVYLDDKSTILVAKGTLTCYVGE
ncbi:MAG: 3-hydroxyacyl-ACP dehydratase FabZ [Lachnospiraceae bacterium]